MGARERFQAAVMRRADLRYPETGTWSDGITCTFGVEDPANDLATGPQKLSTGPLDASLRRLRVRIGDPLPGVGAHIAYAGGTLTLGAWGDPTNLGGLRTGVCILIDARLADFPPRLTDGPLFFLAFLPYLQAGFGQEMTLVRPGATDLTAPADGRGRRPRAQDNRVDVSGLLYQPDARQRAALAGAQLPIPVWQLLLPFSAPVNPADFQVEDANGQRFQITGVPRDEDGKGVVWVIDLLAPGAR